MKKILVIDDDTNITEIISEIISRDQRLVVVANTADLALDQVSSQSFDLILLDINLEGRNGAEIIKKIVEDDNNQNKEAPIIILSGIVNQTFMSKNKNRFAGIQAKPFDHDELGNLVSSILKDEDFKLTGSLDHEDIKEIQCHLPFPIPQLQTKVSKVMDQIKKNSKIKELFKSLKYDKTSGNYMEEHIGMVINISTAISIEMEWSTEKTLEKFVFTAYLHDMALMDKTELAMISSFKELEDKKDSLSKEDYNLIFNHPNIAADKIQTIDEIPSDVAQIIRQHHELPNERGFPLKIGQGKITPLSSIFIVAHDFTDFVIKNENWTVDKYMLSYKMKFKGAHFSKIYQALEKLKKKQI
jgi:response regulator RpfG family c-di-GMP phosphodiesterase